MKHTIKQIFKSPKFLAGFIIFTSLLLLALIWPFFATVGPLDLVTNQAFSSPGTYVNVVDVIDSNDTNAGSSVKLSLDVVENRIASNLSDSNFETMMDYLYSYAGVEEGSLSLDDKYEIIELWLDNYDADLVPSTVITATKKKYVSIDSTVATILEEEGYTVMAETEDGELEEVETVGSSDFVNVNEVANTYTLILGSDNFGRDVFTELLASILVSLKMGVVAGCIATAIGLTLGLLAGYLGGAIDNFITFITNLFTVIPSFVILVLVANSLGSTSRGVFVVGTIIGLTAWPWTCRSVRSQVISLRNRDHVNMSKLSGHSIPRIVLVDILPYVASYVVMALILQMSSAILAETQLSMLGLGPSSSTTSTLGMMMSWATQFTAHLQGAWWAFIPVILSIALVSFSMNLMNTGLDQVFNPQLRD